MKKMISFFEGFSRTYTGRRLDPDRGVTGALLAEKYGIRVRDTGDRIEIHFLSRPVWTREKTSGKRRFFPGLRSAKADEAPHCPGQYNACLCVNLWAGTDRIRSFHMEHWVQSDRGTEPAEQLLTDDEFLRGMAILEEYLDRSLERENVWERPLGETA